MGVRMDILVIGFVKSSLRFVSIFFSFIEGITRKTDLLTRGMINGTNKSRKYFSWKYNINSNHKLLQIS